MRWYGPDDPVSLVDIRQAGCTNIVSALHHIPPGEVWPENEVSAYRKMINDAGMDWHVVESLPVHENIKAGRGDLTRLYDNYSQSISNLGKYGVRVITYNFMPVFDWLRTDIEHALPDGSLTLRFDPLECAVFDLFLLKRPGAEEDYSEEVLQSAESLYKKMAGEQRDHLYRNLLMALPGAKEALTPRYVFEMLDRFEGVDQEALRDNLVAFLEAVIPAAERAGVVLAIHPDDPPFPVLGLPRVVANAQDLEFFLTRVPSKANGLCFCTGSLGSRADNDIVQLFQKWSDRIHFLHLRNTTVKADGSFTEVAHLEGDTDMHALMQQIVSAMQEQQRSIPMRPDHGVKMSHELHVKTYPGYTFAGRAKGLSELRGLEYGTGVRHQP